MEKNKPKMISLYLRLEIYKYMEFKKHILKKIMLLSKLERL